VTIRRDGTVVVDLTLDNSVSRTVELLDELAVGDDILAAYDGQCGQAVWWAEVRAQLQTELEEAEEELEVCKAEIWERERERCAKRKIPVGVQDRTIRARRALDQSWRNASRRVRRCRAAVRSIEYVVKAFDARRDMLISLGAHMRHQSDRGEPVRILRTGLADKLRAQRQKRQGR